MKHKDDFILREIAGEYVIIPVGESAAIHSGIIELSETSAFVWKLLDNPCTIDELVAAVTEEYEVSSEEARDDILKLINSLNQLDALE
ncbi:MAG: PqqD family protein [Lachnospiraceae bacterium]|nr:PqqD family protein [Lachnospiraceae bacterium]